MRPIPCSPVPLFNGSQKREIVFRGPWKHLLNLVPRLSFPDLDGLTLRRHLGRPRRTSCFPFGFPFMSFQFLLKCTIGGTYFQRGWVQSVSRNHAYAVMLLRCCSVTLPVIPPPHPVNQPHAVQLVLFALSMMFALRALLLCALFHGHALLTMPLLTLPAAKRASGGDVQNVLGTGSANGVTVFEPKLLRLFTPAIYVWKPFGATETQHAPNTMPATTFHNKLMRDASLELQTMTQHFRFNRNGAV